MKEARKQEKMSFFDDVGHVFAHWATLGIDISQESLEFAGNEQTHGSRTQPNKSFHQSNECCEIPVNDIDSKNSFDSDSYQMMVARIKNLILVVSLKVIVRRTKKHHDLHFNALDTYSSILCLLEEPLLLKTTKHKLDVALDLLKSYTGYVLAKWSGFIIESSRNIFPFIDEVLPI